jgi:hypothetical protein
MMKEEQPTTDNRQSTTDDLDRLQAQLRQLILMRETGPKRAAWHMARARLIWRLHEALAQQKRREG